MAYALTTIWYERNRFLPAVLAVAFSAILITVQGGLMIGLLSMMSLPVDNADADVWVGYPGVPSIDTGLPIPNRWRSRVATDPRVEHIEPYIIGFSMWGTIPPPGTIVAPQVCTVIGTRLDPQAIGVMKNLRMDRDLLSRLAEPFTVAVDASELGRLGIHGPGVHAEVLGRRVRVVGLVNGYKSLAGPYVFCSVETARELVRCPHDQSTYLLAKVKPGVDPYDVKLKLSRYEHMSAFTTDELSTRSRIHWLTTTKAGIAVGFTALLGLLVGAVVTSQTLYAATVASQREFATMRAMGIPRWRLKLAVLNQAFWVGAFGILVSVPPTLLLAEGANQLGTQVRLHPIVVGIAGVTTLLMAIISGLAALRSLQGVDPAHNIR